MNQERILDVLRAPRITEKTARVGEDHNQYVFQVVKDASKPEIKAAVETLFKVEVGTVQVVNVKGKTKMSGRRRGRRSDWKKAYVTLKPGFEIDFVAAE